LDSYSDDHLFLDTLDELESRLQEGTPYAMLRVGAILRFLLLDGFLDMVNRERRQSLVFRVSGLIGGRPPFYRDIEMAWMSVQPLDTRPNAVRDLTREEFLSEIILIYEGDFIPVREVIRVVANKKGGVHRDSKSEKPKEVKLKAALELDQLLVVENLPATLSGIRVIGNVVHTGLQPLREAVQSDLSD